MNWWQRRNSDGGLPAEFAGRSVAELNGYAYRPRPIPADYQAPPSGLPRVFAEEPTEGWWTQAGRFGLRFQGLLPSEGTVVPLTETLALPGPPTPVWLNWFRYNRSLGNEFSVTGQYELRGRLIYGVGGAQNQVDVDLLSGIQFPIVCNSLTVQFVPYNPYARQIGAAYVAADVICGVMFGKGAGGGALPPTWTCPIFQANSGSGFHGGDNQCVVPDFARSVCVATSTTDPVELAKMTLGFLDLGGALIKALSMNPTLSYNVLSQERGVPIPAGTNSVILLGGTVTNGIRASLQFFLAL